MIDPQQPDYLNTPSAQGRPRFAYGAAHPRRTTPVVSVLTPFFNTNEVFLEAAQSLLAQSFQDFEWTIVDDGSTDDAAVERLNAIQASDSRINVITQANAGPAVARNNAARNSTGRYLCLFDSDDLLEPTFIEKCVWFLESNQQFAFCNSWSVGFGEENFLWTIGFERGAEHLKANSGPLTSVIRASAFDSVHGFDESIRFGHEDWDFWLAMAKAGHWGHTLQEYLTWYRKRSSGRLHQVMNSTSTHRNFQAFIRKKFAGLKSTFPNPTIRFPMPFETPSAEVPFLNTLCKPEGQKRILILLPWMVTGGADRVNLEWVEALTRNGYQVTICATLASYHAWHPQFARLTPDVFVLPVFLRCADYPRFLRYLIESRRIDIVLMSNSTFGYLILPYLRSQFPAIAFVDLCHVEEPEWMNGGHPRFGVGYQEMLDLNLVTNTHLRDWMIAQGARPERIEVCRSGIDVPELDAAMAAAASLPFKLKDEVPVIVFAGRICPQKRPMFLADILQSLAKAKVLFQVIIVGDGELRLELERGLESAQLRHLVHMAGTVEHHAWLQILAKADIFLLPSKYEGISVALLEAMGMGVVPVTAAVGGQGEVVAADCGFLINPGDRELDQYVEALAGLLRDQTMRDKMGAVARQRVLQQYSLQITTTALLAALERARVLAVTKPRQPVTPGYARELAVLAVEYTRVSGVADFLWNRAHRVDVAHFNMNPREWIRGSMMALSASPVGSILRRNPRVHRWGKRVMAKVKAS